MPDQREALSADNGDAREPRTAQQSETAYYLGVLWRRKLLWIVGAILGAAAAWLVAAGRPPAYQATATLMVGRPMISGAGPSMSMASFRALARNQGLATRVIEELEARDQRIAVSPATFVADHLQVEHVVDTNLLRIRVALPDATTAADAANLIADGIVSLNETINQQDTVASRDFIKAELDEAERRLGALGDQLAELKRGARLELLRQEVLTLSARAADLDDRHFEILQDIAIQDGDSAAARLAVARRAMADYESISETRKAQTLLAVALQEQELLDREKTNLGIDIQTLGARLTSALEQLSEESRLLELNRTLDTDAALVEAARAREQRPAMLGLSLLEETLNPTYVTLQQEIVASRTSLAGSRRRLTEVDSKLETNAERLSVLQADLTEKETELNRLKEEYDMAWAEYRRLNETSPSGNAAALDVVVGAIEETADRLRSKEAVLYNQEIAIARMQVEYDLGTTAYSNLAAQYEEARLEVASRSAVLQVVDPAIAPESPTNADRFLVLLGLVIGFMISVLAAFAYEYSVTGQ